MTDFFTTILPHNGSAQSLFEPASILFTPKQPIDRFQLRAANLQGPDGGQISADALDIKVIKVWYQAGSAWYGYFADALARRRQRSLRP